MPDGSENRSKRLSLKAVGTALSVTLVGLYLGCFLSVLFLPVLPLSHAWLGLFTAAWPMSIAGVTQGIAMNIFIGWFAAAMYVTTYNGLSRPKR